MTDRPLVTIVTPSFNTGRFLEETVQSVLTQDYPWIEYVVMDGGSTDGTLGILEKYADRLHYESRPDRGTAEAVNRGFARGTGEIFAFLNADDTLLPGAVSSVVRHLGAQPAVDVVYGEAIWVNAAGVTLERYPTRPFSAAALAEECFICQPACFFRRRAFEAVGGLDPSLQYAFDFDLWTRLARSHRFLKIDERLAASRMHRENKTLSHRGGVFRESIGLLKRHHGYVPFRWVHAYCCYRMDGRDQFFEPLQPSLLKYVVSLPAGIYYNPRHLLRYTLEWSRAMTWAGLVRMIRRAGAANPVEERVPD